MFKNHSSRVERVLAFVAVAFIALAFVPLPSVQARTDCGTTETPDLSSAYPQTPGPTGVNKQVSIDFIDDGATCGIASCSITIDYTYYDHPTYCFSYSNLYRVEQILSTPLSNGPHQFSASVTENCCNAAGASNQGWASWSSTISACGNGGYSTTSTSPSGTTSNSATPVQVVIHDPGNACGLLHAVMFVDSSNYPAAWSWIGSNDYLVTFTPPSNSPFSQGTHTFSAAIQEACCLDNSEALEGWYYSSSGSFTVVSCGSPFALQENGPQGTGTNSQPTVFASFQKPTPDCSIQTYWIKVTPATGGSNIASGAVLNTQTGSSSNEYTVSWIPGTPLAPGTYNAEAFIQEKCCNPAGQQNSADVQWAFTVAPLPFGSPNQGDLNSGQFGVHQVIPSQVTVPQCVAGVCGPPVGPVSTGGGTVDLTLGAADVAYIVNPNAIHHQDPIQVLPDPVPVSVCNQNACDTPDPTQGTSVSAQASLTVALAGTTYSNSPTITEVLP